jgi:hypothetical protein
MTSLQCGNRKFILQLSSLNSHLPLTFSSSPIVVISYRLQMIQPTPPTLWYKDHGGKNKWMKLCLQLVNENNFLIKSRHVPLTLSLHYSCGTLVPNQTLLKSTPTLPQIIETTGEVIIHFRIEEVSRSHQNQLFVVRVSPDVILCPLNNDINFVETAPIRVMSKDRVSSKNHSQIFDSSSSSNSSASSKSFTRTENIGVQEPAQLTTHPLQYQHHHHSNIPSTLTMASLPSTLPSYLQPPSSPLSSSTAPSLDSASNLRQWSSLTLLDLIEVRDRIDTLLTRSAPSILRVSVSLFLSLLLVTLLSSPLHKLLILSLGRSLNKTLWIKCHLMRNSCIQTTLKSTSSTSPLRLIGDTTNHPFSYLHHKPLPFCNAQRGKEICE